MSNDQRATCDRASISFSFSNDRLARVAIKGWLSVPQTLRSPALQILVHGGTYDHHYWDWPQRPDIYSYVEWANVFGYATLAIDHLGAGESDHPPGADVDICAQADAVRAVLAAMREGRKGNRFSHFILIGHSLGCATTSLAASLERVDALVLTGSIPTATSTGNAASGVISGDATAMHILRPARQIPGLEHLDDGYVRLEPEVRKAWMYWQPGADPAVIDYDLAHPDVMTVAEVATFKDYLPTMTRHDIPVLFQAGEYDILADSDVRTVAASLMAALPANFDCEITPDAGHCLALHRNAREGYAQIGRWVDRLRLA